MKNNLRKKVTGLGIIAGIGIAAISTAMSRYGTPAWLNVIPSFSTTATIQQYNASLKEGLIGTTEATPLDNPADNLFHVSLKENLQGNQKVWLVYELSGVADHTSVSRSVNDQLSVGGHLVKKRKGWIEQREQISADWLRKGDNVIRFTLPKGAKHSYRVRNPSLQIENSATSASTEGLELVVNQPTTLPYFGNKAYVKGFIKGTGSEKAQITIDGEKARVFNGEFEAVLPHKSGEKTWKAQVQALLANGKTLQKEVAFASPSSLDYQYGLQKSVKHTAKHFAPKQQSSITLEGTALTTSTGSLKQAAILSITSLREVDMPALDAGMVNVTRFSSGYRYLPHGTKFSAPVALKMAYDATKIPEGYTEQDIKTYFFDENTHHWVALPVDTILASTGEVVSQTTHFTDMINGIIKYLSKSFWVFLRKRD